MVGRRPITGQDTIGRFCWQAFHGNEGRKLVIITAYRVSQSKHFKSPHKRDNTAHFQQKTALLERGILSPDPKQHILHDLTNFIKDKQENEYQIILMIDKALNYFHSLKKPD